MSEELSSRPCEAAAEKEGLAVGDIAQAGVLIALLAVSAQVTVALGPIPFTLQTVAVVLAALVFSPAQAALALGGYLLLGGLGLPVFSAMRGGIAMLAGPTGISTVLCWPCGSGPWSVAPCALRACASSTAAGRSRATSRRRWWSWRCITWWARCTSWPWA